LAAEKTGQVLVRTSPHPGHTESPVISGKKVGYVRRSELSIVMQIQSSSRAQMGVFGVTEARRRSISFIS